MATAFGNVTSPQLADEELHRFYRWVKDDQKQKFLDSMRAHLINVAGHQHGIDQPVNIEGCMLVLEAIQRQYDKESL